MNSFKKCRGMKDDLKRRMPHYLNDWTDVFHLKILSSSLFMFFTSMAPAITFSLLFLKTTEGEIGAIEVLASTALCAIMVSFFFGQPLLIVGVTGPVAILTGTIFMLAKLFNCKFLPFYAWSQVWGALSIMLLAICNSCDLIKYVTRFSCEVFCILIAFIYLYTGIEGLLLALLDRNQSFSSGLLQFIITIGAAYSSSYLSDAKSWRIFNESTRTLISDYGTTLSLVLWSIVPFMARDRMEEGIPTLLIPMEFGTTTGRAWLVDMTDIPIGGVFAAIFPGIVIAVLFFFDHNVSSIITQGDGIPLKKGTAFHWDFFVLGTTMIVTGILGIPPCNGLIPQAPLHAKSLAVVGRLTDPITGAPTEEFTFTHVHEQRLTNLLQGLMCGLVTIRPFSDAMREVPNAVLYGLFLYLGFASFENNEFMMRLEMLVVEPAFRSVLKLTPHYTEVAICDVQKFTFIQAVCCAVIFGITFTQAGVVFPVLLLILVLMRLYLFPRMFTVHDLHKLDAAELLTVQTTVVRDCKFDAH